MSKIFEKANALSSKGRGILCLLIMLALNAIALSANTLATMRYKAMESFSVSDRFCNELITFNSPAYKIIFVALALAFVLIFFAFIKKVFKASDVDLSLFSFTVCLSPVFIIGYSFFRHGEVPLVLMSVAVFAMLCAIDKENHFLLLPLCVIGTLLNFSFIFLFLPVIILSLFTETKIGRDELSTKKTARLTAIFCVAVFAICFAIGTFGDNKYIFAFDFSQMLDLKLYGASSYDGKMPLLTVDIFSVVLIILPSILLPVLFWAESIKLAEKSRKIFYVLCLLTFLPVVSALIFKDFLGWWLLAIVFSQDILILSLVAKKDFVAEQVMKKINSFLSIKNRAVLISFALLVGFAICAYIEEKI